MEKKGVIPLIIILNLSIFIYSSYTKIRINWGESFIYLLNKPFILIGYFIHDSYCSIKQRIITQEKLIKKIKKLEKENKDLKLQLFQFQEIKKENERLIRLLHLNNIYTFKKVVARVIGGSSSINNFEIIINKGRNSGIKAGYGVINENGVVGMVIKSFPTSSKVLLLIDPRFKLDVKLINSRENGILQGNIDNCIIKFLNYGKIYNENELVITAGFNRIFPRGIPVGIVTKVFEKQKLYKTAIIKPFVNFQKLDEVFVIIRDD